MHDPTRPFWLSAFLDVPAETFEVAAGFWAGVTGYPLSPLRGIDHEFGTLVPPEGDDYLRVQRVGSPTARIHLDVHVPDPARAARRAITLGATQVADRGYRVMRSPSGFVFCLVRHPSSLRPSAVLWAGGQRSRVDQVALDLPRDVHGLESDFWAALLDEPVRQLSGDEFSAVDRRPQLPLRLLLHRLDEPTGPTRAHLDLATDDVPAEVARHLALGAEHVRDHDGWTVLRDPADLLYCVTGRDPAA